MSTCTLSWFSDRGFELDLDLTIEDTRVQLAVVPVPADGTGELRAGPIELDRLEILFKAQASVGRAMGQLQEASVQLIGDSSLRFCAQVEDVETGEVQAMEADISVTLPAGIPESGGPRPEPPDEDELDWEDEETLESIVMRAPEPVEEAVEEEEEEDVSHLGLKRLLQAILEEPSGTAPPDNVVQLPQAQAVQEVEAASEVVQVQAADELPSEAEDQLMDPSTEARGLLQLLVGREELELEEDESIEALVPGVVRILGRPVGPDAWAVALSEWLIEQPAVADLYIGDDDLAVLLAQW